MVKVLILGHLSRPAGVARREGCGHYDGLGTAIQGWKTTIAPRLESQVTVLDSDDDEAPLVRGSRPSVVLDGPAHESHSDPQSRPGEVSDVFPQV